VNYCLEEAFIEAGDLDAIVFYDSPLLTLDRVLKNCMQAGEKSHEQFVKASRSILGIKLWVGDYVKKELGTLGKLGKILYTEHHMSHAASAFYPSPFDEAAVITLDGVGEWCTTSIGVGRGTDLELLQEIHYPHSLGLLYSAFTYFCGFKVNSGEYKLMGLAPYGTPKYTDLLNVRDLENQDYAHRRLNSIRSQIQPDLLILAAAPDQAIPPKSNPLVRWLLQQPCITEAFSDNFAAAFWVTQNCHFPWNNGSQMEERLRMAP
jgi:predicted NodU family carbamoyl transferase